MKTCLVAMSDASKRCSRKPDAPNVSSYQVKHVETTFRKSEVRVTGVCKETKHASRSTLIVINQMNDVILLDSSCTYLGANLSCSNNEKLEMSVRECARNVVEEWPSGETH